MSLTEPFRHPSPATTAPRLMQPTAAVLSDVRDHLDVLEDRTTEQLQPYLEDLTEASELLRNVADRMAP